MNLVLLGLLDVCRNSTCQLFSGVQLNQFIGLVCPLNFFSYLYTTDIPDGDLDLWVGGKTMLLYFLLQI
jgi:hypothetical protein